MSLSAIFVGKAGAVEWITIGRNHNNSIFYVDLDSIQNQSGGIRVIYEIQKTNGKRFRAEEIIDCRNYRMQTLKLWQSAETGREYVPIDVSDLGWHPAPPGSKFSSIVEFVCP
jgi:hypothetical protein